MKDSVANNVKSPDNRKTPDKKIISDNKELEYKITNRYIVEPNDTSKINFSNDKKEITLITCINHAKQRLILTGELVNFNLVLKIK